MRGSTRVAVLADDFSPLRLGSLLYDMWDAERPETLSLSGSSVTAWRTVKNGYSAEQATGANQPTYSATSFNGRPGLTFDGTNDDLTLSGVGNFPTGATAGEIWALVDQTALGSDGVAVRNLFGYGGGSLATDRRLRRTIPGTVNTADLVITSTSASQAGYSGRCVLRAVTTGTAHRVDLNGVPGTPATATPATGTTRVRIGASPAGATGSDFHQGVISLIAVTAPLSDGQVAQMLAFLRRRGGIA